MITTIVGANMRYLIATILGSIILSLSTGCATMHPHPVDRVPPAPSALPPAESTIGFDVTIGTPPPDSITQGICSFYKGNFADDSTPLRVRADYELWMKDDYPKVSVAGNTLNASVGVYYWVKDDGNLVQCGWDDELPREIVAEAEVTAAISKEWHVETKTTVKSVTTPNDCILSIFKYNATPKIKTFVQRYLERMGEKFDEKVRKKTDTKEKASLLWQDIQDPFPLGNNLWMYLTPTSIKVTPVEFRDETQTAHAYIEAKLNSKVAYGKLAPPAKTPLPTLDSIPRPEDDSFQTFTEVFSTYKQISEVLNDKRSGVVKSYSAAGRKIKVTNVTLNPHNNLLVAKLDVQTEQDLTLNPFKWLYQYLTRIRGSLYLIGEPVLDKVKHEITWPNLKFDDQDGDGKSTKNVILKVAPWILNTTVLDEVRKKLKVDLATREVGAKDGIIRGFSRIDRSKRSTMNSGDTSIIDSRNGLAIMPVISDVVITQLRVTEETLGAVLEVKGKIGVVSNLVEIHRPVVNQKSTKYDAVTVTGGDSILLSAGGCVQTGGHGLTWKRYVNPIPDDSYYGTVAIPGVISTTKIKDVLNKRVDIPKGTPETAMVFGYVDDNYRDNGYDSRNSDNGIGEQCKGLGDAFIKMVVFKQPD